MATQIKSDAMVSGRGQREAIGGKLGGMQRVRGAALIAALVLALIASVAVGRALSVAPAEASAPGQQRVVQLDPDADAYAMARWARPADTFDWEQWDRARGATVPLTGDPTDLVSWLEQAQASAATAIPAIPDPADLVHWLEQSQQTR